MSFEDQDNGLLGQTKASTVYLLHGKCMVVCHRFDWNSCFCQDRKRLYIVNPHVSQAFVVNYYYK